MDMNLSKFQEIVEDSGAWCAAVHGIAKSGTWFSDWTTTESAEDGARGCYYSWIFLKLGSIETYWLQTDILHDVIRRVGRQLNMNNFLTMI